MFLVTFKKMAKRFKHICRRKFQKTYFLSSLSLKCGERRADSKLARIFLRSMFSILLIFVLILSSSQVFCTPISLPALQWTQTYSAYQASDQVNSVVQTNDGGYAFVGTNIVGSIITNSTSYDLLIKTDSIGNELWMKTTYQVNFNNNSGMPAATSSACSVIQTNDGGYALVNGIYYGVANPSAMSLLIKTDLVGNQLWNITYPSSYGTSVKETNDGGLVWGGYYGVLHGPNYDYIWLSKTNSSGNQLWTKEYKNYCFAYSMVYTSDGGFVIPGELIIPVGSNEYTQQALLMKTDSAGNVIWNQTYGNQIFYSIIQTNDGGYALIGGEYNQLVKTDSSGNLQWNQTYGLWNNTSGFSLSSLVQMNDGNYILGGGNILAETDSAGNLLWYQDFALTKIDCIIKTSDGGFLVAGAYDNSSFWLAKFSSSHSPTPTPPPTPTPESTATPTPDPTPTPIPTPTVTPTPTPTPTVTPTPSSTAAPTPSPTPTPSPSPNQATPTITNSPTPSPTPIPTAVPTPSLASTTNPTPATQSTTAKEATVPLSLVLYIIVFLGVISTVAIAAVTFSKRKTR